MAERTCDEPDCSRPQRARGLCNNHWKLKYGTRTRYGITCLTCGGTYRSSRPDGKYCSHECFIATTRKDNPPKVYVLEIEQVLPLKQCVVCHLSFLAPWPGNFCSQKCEAERYRFRSKSRWISDDERPRIYERDAWRCGICGDPVRQDRDVQDWLGPTLDHIVPRSEGGSDDPANLRLAHFMCNSRRGAGGGGEQLALIG
jgi:predicted nucleic acid-binding Zn ribbon protein